MSLENSHNNEYSRTRFFRGARELVALLCVFYLWMHSQSVVADEDNTIKRASTLWLEVLEDQGLNASDVSKESQQFPGIQLETHVSIGVSGPISRVKVKQVLYNPSQFWVEGQYTYPLPESASVDRLNMLIGERIVKGQIQEKQQALKTFAKARQEGKRASLLSYHRTNQFRTQVTNIPPQETVTIEFEYQEWLDYKDGRYSLRFPMVSTPTYTPSLSEGSTAVTMNDFVYPDHHYRHHGEKAGNSHQISLEIDAGFPVSMPKSDSHEIEITQLDEGRYQGLLRGTAEISNRDFLLSWQPESSAQPNVSVLQEEYSGRHYGLLMIMPPQDNFLSDNAQARELVMVLDVSGSMQGESIRQAKAAVLKALNLLDEGDLFNLIWFNNHAEKLFSVSQKASARNLSAAMHKVRHLDANGGTNMIPALQHALQSPEVETMASLNDQESVLRQVVFITDGAVGNEAELFTMIRQQLGQSRLFTVGIGSAPNSYFMRKAALAGRGSFTYINKPELVEEKVSALFEKLKSPALTNVGLDFQGYEVEVFPKPLPDVYAGEPLYVAFRSTESPEYVTLSGEIDGLGVYTNHALGTSEALNSLSKINTKGIASEWARRKIEYLISQRRDSSLEQKADIKNAIVDLAIDHHLVSKFTSLVAVDAKPVREGDHLHSEKIPSNLPAGWALSKTMTQNIQLAQTSTGLWFNLYFGLFSLLSALMLWRFRLTNMAKQG